jgi:hypothetical protein
MPAATAISTEFRHSIDFRIDTDPVPVRTGFCCAWKAATGCGSEVGYGLDRSNVSEAELMQ